MKKQNRKLAWIIGTISVILLIVILNNNGFAVFGQNPSGYRNYQWNGENLNYNEIDGDNNFFESKHIYLPSYSGIPFCNSDGMTEAKVCKTVFDYSSFEQNYGCTVDGNNYGWFEGEGRSGEGNYYIEGKVKISSGIPYCEINMEEYNAQQRDENSELYKSWWSNPNRVLGWQSTKISSGNVYFYPQTPTPTPTPTPEPPIEPPSPPNYLLWIGIGLLVIVGGIILIKWRK